MIYCWRCHHELLDEWFYYCPECLMEANFGYWGA